MVNTELAAGSILIATETNPTSTPIEAKIAAEPIMSWTSMVQKILIMADSEIRGHSQGGASLLQVPL